MRNDDLILRLIAQERLTIDAVRGLVFASKSNTPRVPAGCRTVKGYLRICVNTDGRRRHIMAHRVVWVSVYGPVEDGWQIDHLNGQKDDNRIMNLEAVLGAVNMKRAKTAGRFVTCGIANRGAPRDPKGRFLPRVGKKAAGRLLDGREHMEMPRPTHQNKGTGR